MIDNVGNVSNVGNEPAFKATLRIDTAVRNSAKLDRVAKKFSEKTANIKDSLTISSRIEEYDNKECFYLGENYENSMAAFFEDSFDNMIEKFSENELVTKLIKITKSLKVINKREAHFEEHHDERFRLKASQQKNMTIAQNFREKNNGIMASRFETMAEMLGKKLARMDAEQKKVDDKAIQTIEKVAKGDEDILGMKSLVI